MTMCFEKANECIVSPSFLFVPSIIFEYRIEDVIRIFSGKTCETGESAEFIFPEDLVYRREALEIWGLSGRKHRKSYKVFATITATSLQINPACEFPSDWRARVGLICSQCKTPYIRAIGGIGTLFSVACIAPLSQGVVVIIIVGIKIKNKRRNYRNIYFSKTIIRNAVPKIFLIKNPLECERIFCWWFLCHHENSRS